MLRRSLLRSLLWALGGATASLVERMLARAPAAARSRASAAELSPADLDDLVAFAEIVVNEGPLAAGDRRYLAEHVQDRASRSRHVLDQYRTAVELLGRLGGARFSSLDPARRLDLVTRHRLAIPEVRPDERLGEHAREIEIVRGRVVPDLIAGYYGSPAGWAIVGYAVFPGRCGDLERYTRPEA